MSSTLNPQTSKPQTLNPKPQTLHPELYEMFFKQSLFLAKEKEKPKKRDQSKVGLWLIAMTFLGFRVLGFRDLGFRASGF